MGVFKEMDPRLVAKAIEGYSDELGAESNRQQAFYRQKSKCPRCGEVMQKEFDVRTAHESDDLLPRALLRCSNCGCLIDPHTNLVVETGSPAKIPVAVPPRIDD